MNSFKLRLNNYHLWFTPIMKFLFEGLVTQIRQAMERAVKDEYEV